MAAGRGSQQYSHLLAGTNDKLNACNSALNVWSYFLCSSKKLLKIINQMLQGKGQEWLMKSELPASSGGGSHGGSGVISALGGRLKSHPVPDPGASHWGGSAPAHSIGDEPEPHSERAECVIPPSLRPSLKPDAVFAARSLAGPSNPS